MPPHRLGRTTAALTHPAPPCPAPTGPGCRTACKTPEETYSPRASRPGRGITQQTAPFAGIGARALELWAGCAGMEGGGRGVIQREPPSRGGPAVGFPSRPNPKNRFYCGKETVGASPRNERRPRRPEPAQALHTGCCPVSIAGCAGVRRCYYLLLLALGQHFGTGACWAECRQQVEVSPDVPSKCEVRGERRRLVPVALSSCQGVSRQDPPVHRGFL